MNLPENCFVDVPTEYFEMDRYKRRIYFLSKTGIDTINYDTEFSVFNCKREIFLIDLSIIGFKLDPRTHHIYIYNNAEIFMMDLETRIRKTILVMKEKKFKIYFLKLNSHLG